MKTRNILFALLAFAATACQEEEVVYKVNADIKPFVDTFFAEAEERGVVFSQNNLKTLTLPTSSKACVEAEISSENGQKILYYKPVIFSADFEPLFSTFEISIYANLAHVHNKYYPLDFTPSSQSGLTEADIDELFDQLFPAL